MSGLTQERLQELLSYDPGTGIFTRVGKRGGRPAGSVAGVTKPDGYVEIRVDGPSYKAHRLAWLYMTGEWPKDKTDHINRNPTDNRWSNLREATHSQNISNSKTRSDSRVGLKGVSPRGSGYVAVLSHGRKQIYLGYFKTPEEAHAAYCDAASKWQGEFFRAGT